HHIWDAVFVLLIEGGHALAQLVCELQRAYAIATPAPAHVHADDVDDRQGAFHDGRKLVSDLNVLPPPGVCTAALLGVVRGLDVGEILVGPVVTLDTG